MVRETPNAEDILKPSESKKPPSDPASEFRKRFLTMAELEKYLTLSRGTIYHLIAKRRLPFIPLSKRSYRFDVHEIDKWMLRQQVKTLADYVERKEGL